MSNNSAFSKLETAIHKSDAIDPGYAAGCMNVAVAVHEICLEDFAFETFPVSFVRPMAMQDSADHHVLASGYVSGGEFFDLRSFVAGDDVQYIDQKGVHDSIEQVIDNLGYSDETIEELGIFDEGIEKVKQNPAYSDSIKDEFKESIQTHLSV